MPRAPGARRGCPARRTLRTNLRFIGWCRTCTRADLPLPRGRAKEPYSPGEIGGFLARADAQPALARRMRAAGLVCLGAGAGLIRADLRDVHGTDVAWFRRSGGVYWQISLGPGMSRLGLAVPADRSPGAGELGCHLSRSAWFFTLVSAFCGITGRNAAWSLDPAICG